MTIDSFQVNLSELPLYMGRPDGIARLEAALLKQLPRANKLLRWAIVKIEPNGQFCCEGAYYLKSAP